MQIASLLSFVAGLVNVTGFLSVKQLTTNVTGHFAFFVDEVFKLNFKQSAIYFLYIFFFFLGSFVSNFLIELSSRKSENKNYILPTAIEIAILMAIPVFEYSMVNSYPNIIACSLLFAMGLQNSLVTTISNASVRTTHLTGLFTDLGIELSQLFFYKTEQQKEKLAASIKLRLTIISFFFLGGIAGGVFFTRLNLYLLILAGILLLAALVYDNIKLQKQKNN